LDVDVLKMDAINGSRLYGIETLSESDHQSWRDWYRREKAREKMERSQVHDLDWVRGVLDAMDGYVLFRGTIGQMPDIVHMCCSLAGTSQITWLQQRSHDDADGRRTSSKKCMLLYPSPSKIFAAAYSRKKSKRGSRRGKKNGPSRSWLSSSIDADVIPRAIPERPRSAGTHTHLPPSLAIYKFPGPFSEKDSSTPRDVASWPALCSSARGPW